MRRAALFAVAAVFVTACGLTSQPRSDGRRLDDGVTPYSDVGALRFCLGSRRLLEDAPREGTCRAEEQTPEACEADADCPSPEACVCGLCRVPFCSSTSDCRTGTVCAGSPRRCIPRCNVDDDCGPYGVCNGGACETACWEASDCPTGELCLVGRCAAIGCGPDGPRCLAGEVCELQSLPGGVASLGAVSVSRGESAPGDDEDARVMLLGELSTPDTPSALVRFISVDGVRFVGDDSSAILPPAGATRISNPALLRTPSGLVLVAEVDAGARLVRTEDTTGNGTGFGPWRDALSPAGWASEVHAPALSLLDGRVILAVAGAEDEGIGLSFEVDGQFTLSAAPTLVNADYESPDHFEGVSQLGGPALDVVETSAGRTLVRVYAHARALTLPVGEVGSSLDLPTSSVVFAAGVSEDGALPTAYTAAESNPTFGRVQNFAPLEEWDPEPVPLGAETLLYYLGENGPRVARNPSR